MLNTRKHAFHRKIIKDSFNDLKNMLYDSEKILVDRLNHNYDTFMEGLRQNYSLTENLYSKIRSIINKRQLQDQLQYEMEELSLTGILNIVSKK